MADKIRSHVSILTAILLGATLIGLAPTANAATTTGSSEFDPCDPSKPGNIVDASHCGDAFCVSVAGATACEPGVVRIVDDFYLWLVFCKIYGTHC